jgi:oxygen-dependent protoporphyrinogen oxidase
VLITLAFARADIGHALDGSGFLVPRREGRFVTACSFATTKWSHLGAADASTVVLRASAGRYGDDRAIDLDDDAPPRRHPADLDDLLSLKVRPRRSASPAGGTDFPSTSPATSTASPPSRPISPTTCPVSPSPVAAYRGLGIPACIRQGRQASGQVAVKFP